MIPLAARQTFAARGRKCLLKAVIKRETSFFPETGKSESDALHSVYMIMAEFEPDKVKFWYKSDCKQHSHKDWGLHSCGCHSSPAGLVVFVSGKDGSNMLKYALRLRGVSRLSNIRLHLIWINVIKSAL